MEDVPCLITCKPLKTEFVNLKKIRLTSTEFTLGRSLSNDAVIPFLAISRSHCMIQSVDDVWIIHDLSTLGIEINGVTLGKGKSKKLENGDIISMEPSKEFVYKFVHEETPSDCPRKRKKLLPEEDMINDVKIKFEQSQDFAMKNLEVQIQNAKHIQTSNILLKEQLESNMKKKICQVEEKFAVQIENLKGEKFDVEQQKAQLEKEKNIELEELRKDMGGRIEELMEQIEKHNQIETELLSENNQLKEKLLREREEFLAELNRENISKHDLLNKLDIKIKEQEERLQEKQEIEHKLRLETEQLREAKEKELHELNEAKLKREEELMCQLNELKKNLTEQVFKTEQEKQQAEQQLTEQIEKMKKINEEEKMRVEQLMKEREEMQKQLNEAPQKSQQQLEELQARVAAREVELAALAAERIQQQADQSGEVIKALQDQLEKVKSQLQSVENEKKILETASTSDELAGAGAAALVEFGEMMESELQCSVCAELFVAATTLNCSHTFCKYCINKWTKKKNDCPVCRAMITSKCRSLVLDSFIEKAVQNLSEDMKKKREELLKSREELETQLANENKQLLATSGGGGWYEASDGTGSEDDELEEEEVDEEHYYDDYDDYDNYDDYDESDEFDNRAENEFEYYEYHEPEEHDSSDSLHDFSDGGPDFLL
ncbi:E3 ubiquitin-protein ligase RNF8-like isoform X2 [Aricia agestis]|uniref:E3 ubiquitin-protein ligase RNF8-like isoform X2 n=1 Tax=Aricia agestis TaxID=91739 RepID=UPI001C20A92A|nr:E3 ubiquitin-protein ligase RNF8-like isoform X2 [Aricia agestis]